MWVIILGWSALMLVVIVFVLVWILREQAADEQRLITALEAAEAALLQAPGLNPANYTHDQVMAQRRALEEAWRILTSELKRIHTWG